VKLKSIDMKAEIRAAMGKIDSEAAELIYLLEQHDSEDYEELEEVLNTLQNIITETQEKLGYI